MRPLLQSLLLQYHRTVLHSHQDLTDNWTIICTISHVVCCHITIPASCSFQQNGAGRIAECHWIYSGWWKRLPVARLANQLMLTSCHNKGNWWTNNYGTVIGESLSFRSRKSQSHNKLQVGLLYRACGLGCSSVNLKKTKSRNSNEINTTKMLHLSYEGVGYCNTDSNVS